ncbi:MULTISPECIES: hypothetical protein [unclassified Corynebacterium]|uniref:Rv1157c family protein n=1 Tax=unclassified Corynebacterium TaxID=2624378 RepID=UPI0029CA30BF|nr:MULTISPECIES: hypothetical protein [unclassified Corynebacterium]WPF66950.1 hypothetical protein OLX12_04285 [Corynebacterium sp. 22KM0430]WPF69438.1 hypothetical protein OLW90_04280 [Corynebacterium sp. 21KM1197]
MLLSRRRLAAGLTGLVTALGLALSAPTAGAVTLPVPPLPEGPLYLPSKQQVQQARDFAAQPWLPEDISSAIRAAADFYEGTGNSEGAVPLPENAPHIAQFYWPTVAGNCIGGQMNSVGTAIGVPGPAQIPAPGAGEGQTSFLFTGLGTAAATPEQKDMAVHWFNLNTLAAGTTPLGNHGINPQGPATLSATADTGKGTIVAVITGSVNTEEGTCTYAPTAGIVNNPKNPAATAATPA